VEFGVAASRVVAAERSLKHSQETGLVYEQLFAADLSKAKRNGGAFPFQSDAFLPPQGMRGELAEKWELKQNPWRLEVQLRKGVMFPAKQGVMAAREMTAEDVVYSFDRINKSPKKIAGYFDHVDKVEATGKHGLAFFLQVLQRRVGLPLRLGLLLGHHAQGSGGRRRAGLEERQRHRPVPDGRLHPGQLAGVQEEPDLLGPRDHRRALLHAAVRRRHHLPLHQGRGDDADGAAPREVSTCWRPSAGALPTR